MNEMLTSGVAIEGFCMTEGITVKQFEQLANEVINDWELTKEHHNSENDLRRHLLNTVRLKIRGESRHFRLFFKKIPKRCCMCELNIVSSLSY